MVPDKNIVKPVKYSTVYYQDFVMLTPKYHFPFVYVISIVFIIGLLYMLYNLINEYVFG